MSVLLALFGACPGETDKTLGATPQRSSVQVPSNDLDKFERVNMSRFSNCDDEEEFAGQFALQMANDERSLKGRKGQQSLRDLEAALLALPEKRLINSGLVNTNGEVCAMGALARYRGVDLPAPHMDEYWGEDYSDLTGPLAVKLRVPDPVARRIAWLNDEGFSQCWRPITEEQRYEEMLSWVRSQIIPPYDSSGDSSEQSGRDRRER